jgi:rhodanese-related sulfurtransferase
VKSDERTIDVAGLEQLQRAPGAAIVDIRPAETYAEGHVPGARSVPVSVVAPTDPAALAALKKFAQVIVYDEGDDLVKAEEFAGELKARNVRFFKPGFAGWTAAGKPVTKGPTP